MPTTVLRCYSIGAHPGPDMEEREAMNVHTSSEAVLAAGIREFVISCPRETHVFADTVDRALQLLDLINDGHVALIRGWRVDQDGHSVAPGLRSCHH